MTRTERNGSGSQKSPRNANTTSARHSQASRALTKLLRHQAENEKIPISPAGWVSMDALLAWRGLDQIAKGLKLSEVFEIVEEDGRVGKGRFGIQYVGDDKTNSATGAADAPKNTEAGSIGTDGAATGNMIEATAGLNISDDTASGPARPPSPPASHAATFDPSSKNTVETQAALHRRFTHPNTPASDYQIRATQGHSMKSIQSADLLKPITLAMQSPPTTVVHGTFYGAWASILATGGLKAMGRNNVHFATGPPLEEVLNLVTNKTGGTGELKNKGQVDEVLSRNKVISGMRWDAQLLIYVDIKRCLEDAEKKGLDMTWWMSGNGVVLTEGIAQSTTTTGAPTANLQTQSIPANLDEQTPIIPSKHAKAMQHEQNISSSTTQQRSSGGEKIVPMEYWTAVVEIKNGLGVIWEQGKGVVQELPERLRNMPVPAGKNRGLRAQGGSGKPRLNVERGVVGADMVDADAQGDDDSSSEDI